MLEQSLFGDDYRPAKKGQWAQFPILTGEQWEDGKRWPVQYQYDGLAKIGKSEEVASFGGWHPNQVAELVAIIDWPEGSLIFPSDNRELFILRGRLLMN